MEKQRAKTTKNKILKAALSLFNKKGIKGTRTKDIASKARVAEVTIYRHFNSKHEIASDLFISYMNLLSSRLNNTLENSVDGSPGEKLASLMDTFLGFARKERDGFNYINAGHYSDLNVSLKKINKPMDVFHKVVTEGIASGDFAQMNPVVASGIVIGILTRLILFHNLGIVDLADEGLASEIKCRALMALVPCSAERVYQA